jgi:hypothetical protein
MLNASLAVGRRVRREARLVRKQRGRRHQLLHGPHHGVAAQVEFRRQRLEKPGYHITLRFFKG